MLWFDYIRQLCRNSAQIPASGSNRCATIRLQLGSNENCVTRLLKTKRNLLFMKKLCTLAFALALTAGMSAFAQQDSSGSSSQQSQSGSSGSTMSQSGSSGSTDQSGNTTQKKKHKKKSSGNSSSSGSSSGSTNSGGTSTPQ
jgi:hypothetical protein